MYHIFGIHYSRWAWLLWPLAFLFRIKLYPDSITQENFKERIDQKSVVYVMPRMSIIDTLALNKALKILNQPKVKIEARPKRFRHSALLALKGRKYFFYPDGKDNFVNDFMRLLRHDPRAKANNLVFIPVSVFWSRAAERDEQNFLLRSLFPDDGTGNGLQKLLMLFLHRGEVNVSFGKNIDLDPAKEIDYDYVKKIKRLFHIEFARERTAAFGPTLYDNDKIHQWILSSAVTQKFLKSCENSIKTEKQIIQYIREISANYNYITVRAVERLFDFIWNHVFEGVEVRNFESIERLVKDGQVLWVPSHRSHFDYLLLSYVLFKRGLVTPHVAAGINLNFWPMGMILRRMGAFFIRRSFSGNKTYAHTFSQYVNFLLQNSFPIEFFHEGGRSRIGKLLSPKLGMLSICVQSIISRKAENSYFIPVYFGYDKVMEDDSYAKELRGAKKQKENAFQFLNGVRKIFANYGSVNVSFGTPIRIGDIWAEYTDSLIEKSKNKLPSSASFPKNFRDLAENEDTRSPLIQNFVKYLGKRINQRVNSAAIASGTALLSTALLAQEKAVFEPEQLRFYVLLLHWLVNCFGEATHSRIATIQNENFVFEYLQMKMPNHSHVSKDIVYTPAYQAIEHLLDTYFKMGEKWRFIKKTDSSFTRNPDKELALWWYRGTSFHIFAAFSIFVTLLLQSPSRTLTINDLESYFLIIRRIWQDELFWERSVRNADFVQVCLKILSQIDLVFYDQNSETVILNQDPSKQQMLNFISRITRPEIELYGIQIASAIDFVKQKGAFTKEELLQKSFMVHTAAHNSASTLQPPVFSKVFGSRIFDACFKFTLFTPHENQKFCVNTEDITSLEQFLDLKLWHEFATLK